MPFAPKFSISSRVAASLLRIGAARQAVSDLPITASVLARLRETARLFSTHYSTAIEGNLLTQEEVAEVIERKQHLRGRERDEKEVLGYYAALEKVESLVSAGAAVSELHVRTLHGLVMGEGRKRVKPTAYRDGQNVIRDSRSRGIVYLPPEATDVPGLMAALVEWVAASESEELPCPIRAGLAHYQFATIHPYFDGNGRTARLLTTLILQLGGFDLKGLYSLEEYYARDLSAYYEALTVGPSHNYYSGRAEADVTKWLEYFCEGMAVSFESVRRRAQEAAASGALDQSKALRRMDPRQRQALGLFRGQAMITSRDVEALFGISQRAARNLLSAWVADGFVVVTDAAKKSRRYRLSDAFDGLMG